MHDPYTQIQSFKLFTLWHKDPEHRGDDDSCGWFPRSYHGDKKVMEEIVKEFEFNFKHNYWFSEDGVCKLSTMAITLEMYSHATWIFFKRNRKKQRKYLNKHLYDILHFAENPFDSLERAITNEVRYRLIEHDRSQVESREDRIRSFASIVYGDILRTSRPWYKHPRWHIHHWRFSINWYAFPIIRGIMTKRHLSKQAVDQVLRDTV